MKKKKNTAHEKRTPYIDRILIFKIRGRVEPRAKSIT